jgi:hypothetical protein
MRPSNRLRTVPLVLLCSVAFAELACSSSSATGGNAQAAGSPSEKNDASTKSDASATGTSLQTLISGDWTMPPGTEGYVCVRKTVDEDLYVSGFEAINPLGTHHTLLTMGAPNAPDGTTECSAAENRPLSVFGSGVGTNPLDFPDGLAVKIAKGTQLLLNLHLFNTGVDDLKGSSGTRVRTMAKADVKDIAEGLLAGTIQIAVPPGETKTTTGYCTMSNDVTIFAVAPHMHQLGIHEKVVAEPAKGSETVLLDADYDFNEQSYRLIDPLKLAKGDRVRVECTHRNTTTKTVTFGESTLSEMCFAGLYRYPADGSLFVCVDAPHDQ